MVMIFSGFLRKRYIHLTVISILSLIAYSNTFHVPFQLDDPLVIAENPIIKDMRYFTTPSEAKVFQEHFGYHTFRNRYIGYLSLALNYKLNGLDVTGFHIVNLLIHLCTAISVYFLVILTFNTPLLCKSGLNRYSAHIAVFTSLVFACHPVQTAAVTYIWQRVSSLATMFYVVSLVLYTKWRTTRYSKAEVSFLKGISPATFYLLSVFSAVLAMKTKQTAFTLPVIVCLYEIMFFDDSWRKRIYHLFPFFLTMLIIPVTLIDVNNKPLGELMSDVGEATRDLSDLSRQVYLFTQLRVIVTYIRLIFLPVNLNLDYDYPLYYSLFDPAVFLSFLFLSILLGTGVYLLLRNRHAAINTRVVAFGIFWFFITLSVESSVIPIAETIFEYRIYLPSIGLILSVITSLFLWADSITFRRVKAGVELSCGLTVIVLVLAGMTYIRNTVWNSEISLWEDTVKKSPAKARAINNLGNAYNTSGLMEKAVEQYKKNIEINPQYKKSYFNLGNTYRSQGQVDLAIEQYLKAISIAPVYPEAYINLGNTYKSQGQVDLAIEQYLKAISIAPVYPEAYNNLGSAYKSQGLIDLAIEQYRKAISVNPAYPEAYNNLGSAYKSQGLIDLAIEQYLKAINLDPDNPVTHYNLGNAYYFSGEINEAIKKYETALRLKPDFEEARDNLDIAYRSLGFTGNK
jgi:tetratricopeptide (TPR) repeat protein